MRVELQKECEPCSDCVVVSLPIRENEYADVIRRLEMLGIGGVMKQDCVLSDISDEYPVLQQMRGTRVNIDELDHLAHWLETASASRIAAFQALASKRGLWRIQDFINLAACCYQATVITDFSDLEKIGLTHYKTIHIGADEGELRRINPRDEALELIRNRAGTVTPYGVIYENGMEFRGKYNGGPLPDCEWSGAALSVIVMWRTTKIDSETFLHLPACNLRVERAMIRSGLAEDNRECAAIAPVSELSYIACMDYERMLVCDLNALAWSVSRLNNADRRKLNALLHYLKPTELVQVTALAERLDYLDAFVYQEVEGSEHLSLICYQGPVSLDEFLRLIPNWNKPNCTEV